MNFDVNSIKYINEINIQQKLQGMKNAMKIWKGGFLTLYGNVAVIKKLNDVTDYPHSLGSSIPKQNHS